MGPRENYGGPEKRQLAVAGRGALRVAQQRFARWAREEGGSARGKHVVHLGEQGPAGLVVNPQV